MMHFYLPLNFILVIAGIIIIALHSPEKSKPMRYWAMVIIGLQIWLMLEMYLSYDLAVGGIQYQLQLTLARFPVLLGSDGLSLLFLLVLNIALCCSLLFNWHEMTNVKASILTLLFCDFAANGLVISHDWQSLLFFLGLLLFSLYTYLLTENAGRVDIIRRFSQHALKGYFWIIIGSLLIHQLGNNFSGESAQITSDAGWLNLVWAGAACFFLLGAAYLMPLFPFQNWLIKNLELLQDSERALITTVLNLAAVYLILRLVLNYPSLASSLALIATIWGLIDLLYCSLLGWGQKESLKALGYWRVAQSGLLILGLGCLAATRAAHGQGGGGVIFLSLALGLITPLLLAGVDSKKAETNDNNNQTAIRGQAFHNLTCWFAMGIPGSAIFVGYLLLFLKFKLCPFSNALIYLGIIGLLISEAIIGKYWWTMLAQKRALKSMSYNRRLVFWLLIITLTIGGLVPSVWLRMINSTLSRVASPSGQLLETK